MHSVPKVAMISGGNRGIGLATARQLLAEGWYVSIGCRQTEISDLSKGESVSVFYYNAQDPESEKQWFSDTISKFGRVDALIINAGIMTPGTVIDATDDEYQQIVEINVTSPWRLSKLVWPALKKSGNGKIVIMSSLSGKRVASAGSGLYSMSKFALTGLTHALRLTGAEERIRVTAICPSYVATDMAKSITDLSPEKMTQPESIATLILTVLKLPFEAGVAEIPVHWNVEPMY
ncbi:SDR family NAD(P)-dependent oxidoreductase [Rosenbergiella australiborealis]|nr:SDR family NAD(P)-dependent oxidoreductase [Rosenbergiella australiborealis]